MIQVTKRCVMVSTSANELAVLRKQFEDQNYVRLPKLLDRELLHFVQGKIGNADFSERIHESLESNMELCLREGVVTALLRFHMNSAALFQVIQQITGCPRIGCFSGRVYRLSPGAGHHDAWHDDMAEDRMIAMSINLSTEVYSGGALQIRDARSRQVLHEAVNTGFGDAIVFRLADHLEHRVTDVGGIHCKTAFAGWFRAKPDFVALLNESMQS